MRPGETERRSGCPINLALEVFGDRWSLLVVRDLMFNNRSTFKEFSEAEERIASNILTDRLQKLEACGVIEKARDPEDRRKIIYRLTEKGIDLAPVLVEIILWSARYEKTDAPPEVIRMMTANPKRFLAGLRKQWAARRA